MAERQYPTFPLSFTDIFLSILHALVHAGGTHDRRVDGEDIGHGHKGGNPCHDFGLYGGVTFRQMENSLHETCIVFHE
jgi:hypothetical protein